MSRTRSFGGVALVGFLLLGAGDVAAQQSDEVPPPIAYRVSIMQGLAAHSGALRGIVNDGAGDPTHILDHATALVQLSLMAASIFPEGTGGEQSRAKDEIWQNPAEFQTRLEALQGAASTLLQAAYSGDRERIQEDASALQRTCGGCHREFRKPAPAGN